MRSGCAYFARMGYYTYYAICLVGMALFTAGMYFLVYGISFDFGVGVGVGSMLTAALLYFGSKAEAGDYD